jgi:hypothetical protein
MFADEAAAHVDIPSTILGWFAADDVWDEKGRRAMFERARSLNADTGPMAAAQERGVIRSGRTRWHRHRDCPHAKPSPGE